MRLKLDVRHIFCHIVPDPPKRLEAHIDGGIGILLDDEDRVLLS